MYKHHEETIKNVKEAFQKEPHVIGVLLGGSIAHGFAKASSDVDIMIVVEDAFYEAQKAKGHLTYYNHDLSTYEGGYVDGKYITFDYMEAVIEQGNEATRYAFDGAQILFSKSDRLDALMKAITTYPVADKADKIKRFYAQLEAWKWYCDEAIRHENRYLLNQAAANLTLFGGRLILVDNEQLFPYHKWFTRVLETVKDMPEGFMEAFHGVQEVSSNWADSGAKIQHFFDLVKDHKTWLEGCQEWPDQFVRDSEMHWKTGFTPVGDL